MDNSCLTEMVQQKEGGGGCVHVCVCVTAFMCVRIKRMRPSPNDDVNIMKAQFFSPQGSHVLHTNPPVS